MTLTHLLEQQARAYGNRPFLLCDDAEYSYAAMHENAGRVATHLGRMGVSRGDKIALLMGNSLEFLYVFLGAGRIGAVAVPINPTLKSDEIAYITGNSDACTLITTSDFIPLIPTLRELLPQLKRLFIVGDSVVDGAQPYASLLEPAPTFPEIAAGPQDDAALIYTSGTTGLPKGVILTHNNYVANARMIRHATGMTDADRFFCVLPLFHVNAQVVTIVTPLLVGADVLLMKKFNPFAILPMIEKYRPTILSAVPTIYNIMCRMPKAAEFDVSSIRFFASGAAPMPEETYREVQRVLKRPLIMGYGLSEATCASAAADYRDPIKWDSVGSPVRYTGIRIVGEDGRDVPFGSVGEILIAGPAVMKGYYKNPEATQAAIENGWLHTGDLGRFDEDGYLYIVGRVKDMIIRGGQNVYPQQVENVVSQFPGVEECCVVGVEEERWGQEILAVIKPVEGHTLDEREIIAFCRERLAAYKCPRFVRFVTAFPKTATGKIKKHVVAADFAHIARA